MFQTTGEPGFDEQAARLARQFDVEVMLALRPSYLLKPGRSITGRAVRGRHGAFAEAGVGGLVEADAVRYHHDGVLRIAAALGMLPHETTIRPRDTSTAAVLSDYCVFESPATGWCVNQVMPGERVEAGDVLSTIERGTGGVVEMQAPLAGIVLWQDIHPLVSENQALGGIGS